MEIKKTKKEEEIRLLVLDALGISKEIKMLGSTDGVWNGRLFEFKNEKHFREKANWKKTAYGALAQTLYYCRKILNFEVDGLTQIPHTIVICDKYGGFIIQTKQFEGLLHYDNEIFNSSAATRKGVQDYFGKDWLKKFNESSFSWDEAPSSQNKLLVELLISRGALSGVRYFDFSSADQLQTLLSETLTSSGESPKIPITRDNFIGIYEKWFQTFAPKNASRREWADRFVIDLRVQFKINESTGILTSETDEWSASIDLYKSFWAHYKRPPAEIVDEFIATNKDLIYDETDQNNHGDFYTPIRLAGMAHRVLSKHMKPTTSVRRLWWDPAAGGGNLFFRFNPRGDKIILTTKFKPDCDGLRNNKSVSADEIIQLDFVQDQLEYDLTLQKEWKRIREVASKCSEIVFFMNPPFDDQAESKKEKQGRTKKEKLSDAFLYNEDIGKVAPRALRALHTRFMYRIFCLARTLNKPVWIAAFSKTAWVVGPDGESFLGEFSKRFKFLDGFIVSSKVFNGVKKEWPCLFSVWKFDPNESALTLPDTLTFDTYDASYTWLGRKNLRPFSSASQRLTEIAKLPLSAKTGRSDYVDAVPLKNEFEVSEKTYEDKLPKNTLGYFRVVANDVYHSAQDLQLYSSISGTCNHNGIPILPENFESVLAVYGIRRAARADWLNDKDEFYVPSNGRQFAELCRMATVFGLIDGGYTSSLKGLKWAKKTFELRNQFFLGTRLELRNWGAKDIPTNDSFAATWIISNRKDLSELENESIQKAKALIKETFKQNVRAKGDPNRQLGRGDASIRQIINGLIAYDGAVVPEDLKRAYSEYIEIKEKLRAQIEKQVYRLGILTPFEKEHDFEKSRSA